MQGLTLGRAIALLAQLAEFHQSLPDTLLDWSELWTSNVPMSPSAEGHLAFFGSFFANAPVSSTGPPHALSKRRWVVRQKWWCAFSVPQVMDRVNRHPVLFLDKMVWTGPGVTCGLPPNWDWNQGGSGFSPPRPQNADPSYLQRAKERVNEKDRVATLNGRLPTSPGSLAHNRLSHSSGTVRNLSLTLPNTSNAAQAALRHSHPFLTLAKRIGLEPKHIP